VTADARGVATFILPEYAVFALTNDAKAHG
jgi:hypothetical protein